MTVFYRRWRPQTLAQVLGQEHVTQTLAQALATGRVAHAYLFCGPRGTGKTSTGRILAKALNCQQNGKGEPCNTCELCQATNEGRALDLVEIDAASNRGIDEIRDLREKVQFAPAQARYKVYIVDEVHMLTDQAFNALLKTLEEPPPYAVFILATTEAHKVPLTIISRCQRYDFRRISRAALVAKLETICAGEGIRIGPEALALIAQASGGSLRDAENFLEQLSISWNADLGLAQVQSVLGLTGDPRVGELAQLLLAGDVPKGLATIAGVAADGVDLRQFHRELVECLRGLLRTRAGAGPEGLDEPSVKAQAQTASLDRIAQVLRRVGEIDFRWEAPTPLPLEMALVELALAKEARPRPQAEPGGFTAPPRPAAATTPRPAYQKPPYPRPAYPPRPAPAAQGPRPVPDTIGTGGPPYPTRPPSPARGEPFGQAQGRPDEPRAAHPSTGQAPAEDLLTAGNPDTADGLRLMWRRALSPDKTTLAAILRSCRVLDLEGETLVLEAKGANRDFLEKLDNRRQAEELLNRLLGRAFHVRCQEAQPRPKPGPAPARPHEGGEQGPAPDLGRGPGAESIVPDGYRGADAMVKAALQLGARMVHREETE